ncbi:hypothetical protein HGP17_31535 [Rhizobium sp. P38BS-XIX]|uniref:hypothetical protein n=1 Tax=Rhizobium sp. P38BS-XIX TaxID=2726740 RepID=UPI001456D5B1|nr:hypothetical protein [Rhizobium sp. P38BS-XIX]NLS01390.1 hypothetical protein [Rhizobium sp. P38BS-XIX]
MFRPFCFYGDGVFPAKRERAIFNFSTPSADKTKAAAEGCGGFHALMMRPASPGGIR